MSQETPSQTLVEQHSRYVDAMMQQGKLDHKMEKALQERGLTREESRQLIRYQYDQRRQAATIDRRREGLRLISIGGVICLAGLLFILGTMSAAASSGNRAGAKLVYMLPIAAVTTGGGMFVRGVLLLMD